MIINIKYYNILQKKKTGFLKEIAGIFIFYKKVRFAPSETPINRAFQKLKVWGNKSYLMLSKLFSKSQNLKSIVCTLQLLKKSLSETNLLFHQQTFFKIAKQKKLICLCQTFRKKFFITKVNFPFVNFFRKFKIKKVSLLNANFIKKVKHKQSNFLVSKLFKKVKFQKSILMSAELCNFLKVVPPETRINKGFYFCDFGENEIFSKF